MSNKNEIDHIAELIASIKQAGAEAIEILERDREHLIELSKLTIPLIEKTIRDPDPSN